MTSTSDRAGRREWIGLAALALPCLVVVMDLTVLHLAVPTITAQLQPSPAELLWIVDIYGFLLAGLLITMGTLGDRTGRRRLLLCGAGAFIVASVLAAFSSSAIMLIAARALLGVAGATLAPSTLALIRNMFHDPTERTTAIAIWGSSFAAGSALGPIVGGVLLEHLWWGSVFLVPVPVMVLLLAIGPRVLPEYRDPHPGRIDLFSVALSMVAVLSTIYGLKLLAQDGPSAFSILAIAIGLALGTVFVHRQNTLAHPLIDLQLFGNPAFSVAVAILTLNALVMFAESYFAAQYVQLVIGFSPLQAGLCTLPGAITVIAASMLSPTLVRRFPRDGVMVVCLLVCALGFGLLTLVGTGGLPVLIVGTMLICLGAGPVGTLVSDAVVSSAPPERAGSAASMSETGAEFGGALGIAALGSVGVAMYRVAMNGVSLPGMSSEVAQAARGTLGGAVAATHDLPPAVGALVMDAARSAFAQGFVAVCLFSAVLMVGAAAILATVALRNRIAVTAPLALVPVTAID
jgi:MFS transporter, DHA2 family, multidrug resistance protein